MCTHKWAALRHGIPRATIGRPSRYTYHITCERCAEDVRRACVRMCAHLEKRTVSSRVVGVGTALAMYEDTRVRLCARTHTYTYICSYRARRHSLKRFRADARATTGTSRFFLAVFAVGRRENIPRLVKEIKRLRISPSGARSGDIAG